MSGSINRLSTVPLWAMAFEKSPFARGEVIMKPTLKPPADWPKIVTWAGSPPKRAMLAFTQFSAAVLSISA